MKAEFLYERSHLLQLDQRFCHYLETLRPDLAAALVYARDHVDESNGLQESELILQLTPFLEDFIAELFLIQKELETLRQQHHRLAPLYTCKRQFVQRIALKQWKVEDIEHSQPDPELDAMTPLELADCILTAQRNPETSSEFLDRAARYCAWASLSSAGKKRHAGCPMFQHPKKLDFSNLIPREDIHIRYREGFGLTDPGPHLEKALDHAHYCIGCHEQSKDSCSKGYKNRKTGEVEKNPLGIALHGCPLEEKISEMNVAKSKGHALGALAIAIIDNPMLAATGHRICNDCMKACIYQKQDPVDIPYIETQVLKDVLDLPWGFEIYSLLTRWNPLNFRRPYPKASTGRKILVVGLGPAGFTLSHHLLNEGHHVVAIDGLKIEPLDPRWSGVDIDGSRHDVELIKNVDLLWKDLEHRDIGGFGGVAEYGITVRWDKNFLTLIRLLLERRSHFMMMGGIRFGGTITPNQAKDMGFDHIALCMGAGKPNLPDIPNILADGVRTASDFLMALQLTGASRLESLANLQIRLPVVVVGGGLTAIDAATEALAYYPMQVEKFISRVESCTWDQLWSSWNEHERMIALEWLEHAQHIRDEKQRALQENRPARILELLQQWGGVNIAYRRQFVDSPAYTLNHEEVHKALEEGIGFIENMQPLAIVVDDAGCAQALKCQNMDRIVDLPAKTILMAIGTQPNTVIAHEYPEHFDLDQSYFQTPSYFQAIDEFGNPVSPSYKNPKPSAPQVFVKQLADQCSMSFLGDLHPSFFGNVVKAMASAKQSYPIISRAVERQPRHPVDAVTLFKTMRRECLPKVIRVDRLTPNIVEVWINAPSMTKNFKPGQFYRLQNYKTFAEHGLMEGLALTGATVQPESGVISLIVLEMGGSSNLCQYLKPGEPVILMGPTGEPTHIPQHQNVMLVGGGLGNAVLLSIAEALKNAGNKVLYFAGYKKIQDRYYHELIESHSDCVVWCCDEGPGFISHRPQDYNFVANMIEAMINYDSKSPPIRLSDIDHMIVIGSDAMMSAVAGARQTILKPLLTKNPSAIASINSPMQCMMKEICGQCLQRHIDPVTGEERMVFSCTNQDQSMDCVDFKGLNLRLKQNSVQEKLTAAWLQTVTHHVG